MRCEDTAAIAADYLAGTLTDEAMDSVRAHTATCEACRDELAGLDQTWQMLGIVSQPRPDSAAMRARFSAVLEGYQQGMGDTHASSSTVTNVLRTWWSSRLALQMAAAAAVLVAGVALGRLTTSSNASNDDQLTAMRRELGDMRQMVTMSLLQQQSAAERLEGVAWTSRIERPGTEVVSALLDTLMHDPNVNVRLASIEALKRFADQDMVRRSTLQSLPQQSSPLVQIALIDFVLESSGSAAAPALRQLSQDAMTIDAVRMHAARGLEQIGAKS
jgi:hypothetical protein